MFDFQDWIEVFKTHYREHNEAYNDTVDMVSKDLLVLAAPGFLPYQIFLDLHGRHIS